MASSNENKPIRDINLNCLRGCLGVGLGWVFWQITSPEFFLFGWVAIVCGVAGVWKFGEGLWGLAELIKGQRKLATYKRKGSDPKADATAKTSDLKKAGILR